MSLERVLGELLKVEHLIFIAQSLQLGCQLDDLKIGNAHLRENLLDTLQRNHAGPIILLTEESESVLDVNLGELRVRFQRKNAKKLIKIQCSIVLFEQLLKLGCLFLVWLKANHTKDSAQGIVVNTLVSVAWVLLGLEVKDFFEVFSIDVCDAWLGHL